MSLYVKFDIAELPLAGLAEIYRATKCGIDQGINRA
jgi:hypothetical protein